MIETKKIVIDKVPINEEIMYLKDVFEESDDEEFKDGNDKHEDDHTNDPPVLDLSLSAVASDIADASFTYWSSHFGI
jgi:hypothetical protein